MRYYWCGWGLKVGIGVILGRVKGGVLGEEGRVVMGGVMVIGKKKVVMGMFSEEGGNVEISL